jgi:hypothetical protein
MLEMTTSSAISSRRLEEKEMINTMQFRLADATETVSTGRMIFNILDTNYCHAAIIDSLALSEFIGYLMESRVYPGHSTYS